MKISLFGPNGQVGWELARSLSVLGEVRTHGRDEADLSRPETLRRVITATRPDIVVNAAAYTAVDLAESDTMQAKAINADAVVELAAITREVGGLFVHYSTDYVFDGSKDSPYVEADEICPVNAYGATKQLGEQAIMDTGGDWLTFRTTWVYAARGKNFLRTILRLASEREELKVIADQIGAPTWARSIADCTAQVVAVAMRERKDDVFTSGIYHMTAAGQTSWHGFAEAAVESWRSIASAAPLAVRTMLPIETNAYPLPANRPANSVLSNDALKARFGVQMPEWRYGVDLCVKDLLGVGR